MKNIFTLFCLFVLLPLFSKSQINYPPATSQNLMTAYSDISTSGTLITTSNYDNDHSIALPIGFNFTFNGATQTHFILSTNGFIKLGANASMTAPSADTLYYTAGNNYLEGIFNSTDPRDVNLISAFNHDLDAGSPQTNYYYQTTGTSPNRVCTIQFTDVRDKTSTPLEQYDKINFQIKLYENKNIEVIFGDFTVTSNNSEFKSSACGLKGSSTTDILAVTKGSTVTWDLASFLSGNYTGNAFNFGNNVGPTPRPLPAAGRTFRFIPAFPNDKSVKVIYSMGNLPKPYALPHTISALVSNFGLNNSPSFKVYLDISGANNYKDTVTVSTLNSGVSTTVSFTGYSPDFLGSNTLTIYLDADDYIGNDTLSMSQNVTTDAYSYSEPNAVATGGLGFNTGSGLILTKFNVKGKRYVTGADVFLWSDVVGKNFYAVVMDQTGTIVAQSPTVIGTTADSMAYKHFDFDPAPLFVNKDFYVGIAQLVNVNGWFPQGTVEESPVRAGAFYYTGLAGSATPVDLNTTTLLTKYLTKGYIGGNDIKIIDITGIPKFKCPSSNEAISVVIVNNDSTIIDFNIDTLKITASTASPINQSFSTEINTGIFLPGDTMTVLVGTNFDFSTSGNYVLKIRSSITLEVDSNNNKKNFAIKVIPATPSVSMLIYPFTEVCYGDSVAFMAQPITGGSKSYQWKIDNVNVGPITTDSIFSPNNILTSKISVDLITEDCNNNTITVSSNDTLMTISPAPLSVLGNDTVQENTNELYFFSPRPNSSITWNVTNGVPDNTTSNRVNIDWGSAGTGIIEITEIDNKNCTYVNIIEVKILSIVGVEKYENEEYGFGNIYPNPSNGLTNISIYSKRNMQVSLKLYDATGKEISEIYQGELQGNKTLNYGTESLTPGVYLFELSNEEGYKQVKRLTVIR